MTGSLLDKEKAQMIHKINELFEKSIRSGELDAWEQALIDLKAVDPQLCEEVASAYIFQVLARKDEIDYYEQKRLEDNE